MENSPVIIEAKVNAGVHKVWEALTDNNEMKKWYFPIPEFRPEVGFHFQFEGGSENKIYIHLCEVAEVVPQKKLSYSWRYKDYPGNSLVSFELFPDENKTSVKVTHQGLESFPKSSDFSKESFRNGWTAIIGKNLKEFVEKKL